MNGTKLLRTLGVAAGLTVASIGLAGAASAEPLEHETFHSETTVIIENPCGVPGLTVQVDRVLDGKTLVNTHGPDGLQYTLDHEKLTEVFTNTANGTVVTLEAAHIEKDLKVTDNGDGTLTVLVMATGNDVLSGPDGKAIARNPGQTRVERLFDNAGTPTDRSDDTLLSERVVTESTGRTDTIDFCTVTVPALLG
jgi:FlaG/FlaF family flagellin (archaellin)